MENYRSLDKLEPFVNQPTKIEIMSLPNHGLYHPKQHIIDIRKHLFTFNIEKIANYSDYIVRSSLNEKWMKEQIEMNNNNECVDYDLLTTTSVGNIAYISLNSDDEKIREDCKKTFHTWLSLENVKYNNKWKKIKIFGTFSIIAFITFLYKRKY